jgi:hypothetical protein
MGQARIRQSQVVSTYGPGALVDLPDHAVLVAGLESWTGQGLPVQEPRLLAHLREQLKIPHLELRAPPVPERDDDQNTGMAAWEFPEWFLGQEQARGERYGRSRPLVHRSALRNGYLYVEDETGKMRRRQVVPVRFVQGCPCGHISDIDWPKVLHPPGQSCPGNLWLEEHSTTGDLADLRLRCDACKNVVPMSHLQGSMTKPSVLGDCEGYRLWLGRDAREVCADDEGKPHKNRLLIRHASNAYFPVVERAISIPDPDRELRQAVDAVWDAYLQYAESVDDIRSERRKKPPVKEALANLSDEKVWSECQRRTLGDSGPPPRLKDLELATFMAQPEELGEDVADGDFYARRLPGALPPKLERVVLAHRLREVVAQVGFTRFEAPAEPLDQDMGIGVRVASLAREVKWLPAVENRGEGIFLSVEPDAVARWLTRPAVRDRAQRFRSGMEAKLKTKGALTLDFLVQIGMPYILLHSLSHLLLTAVSLECGYASASIRERIYVRPDSATGDAAYGLLLYTGTPDAEGTLGGLVEVGRRIGRHLLTALELGRLCSNDPVCAHHLPDELHAGRPLHGAACHGCLLIAEPSCERRNEMLDRALVVPTVEDAELAFFEDAR